MMALITTIARIRRHARFVPVAVIFFVSFAAYSQTLTRWHTYDALAYACKVRACVEGFGARWPTHPHHLLFETLGVGSWSILNLVCEEIDALTSVQYMNAFFGALGLVFIYLILTNVGFRFGKRPQHLTPVSSYLAVAAVVVVGSSFGYWTCATDGRVNMPGMVVFLVAIGLALGMIDSPSRPQCAATALASALAVSLHQSHGLLAFAATGAMLLCQAPLRRRVHYAALYAGVFTVGVAGAYVSMALLVKDIHSYSDFTGWVLAYAQDGRWWSLKVEQNLILDMKALAHVFVTAQPSGEEGAAAPEAVQQIRALSVLSLVFIPLTLSHALYTVLQSVRLKTAAGERVMTRAYFTVLALVIVPYSAFFTIWNPGYFVFWIPTAVTMVVWATLLAGRWPQPVRCVWAVSMIAWGLAILNVNLSTTLIRRMNRDHNPYLVLCDALNKNSRQGDAIITTGTGELAELESYIPYFTNLKLISMNLELKSSGGDPDRAVEAIRKAIARSIGQNHRVIVLNEFIADGSWREWETRRGLEELTPDRILAGYQAAPLFVVADRKAYYLTRDRHVYASACVGFDDKWTHPR